MKKIIYLVSFSFILLVLSGCSNKDLTNNTENNIKDVSPATIAEDNTSNPEAPITDNSAPRSSFNLEEIAQHNSADNCWTTIDGQVYDLTSFIQSGEHPGGDKILNSCGKEASVMFKLVTKHEPNARALLPSYLIGVLGN